MINHERPAPVTFKGINAFLFRLTRTAARLSLAPFFTLKVEGQEHLYPKRPFVLLPKHQRWEDIPLLGLSTPIPLYYVAKYELFVHPISKWFISSLGGISLNRKKPLGSREAIKNILSVLEKGERVVVFPEGTYYKNRMGPCHSGMIRMIHSRSKVAFIPVGIHYSLTKVRQLVRVRFGQPMVVDASPDIDGFMNQVTKEIARLSDLSQTSYEGKYSFALDTQKGNRRCVQERKSVGD